MRLTVVSTAVLSLTAALGAVAGAGAQVPSPPAVIVARAAASMLDDDRSGPRIGAAYIIGGSATAASEGKSFTPLTTLFGWQLERQFSTGDKNSLLPVSELVFLAGGIEQGLFLPSVTWMLGIRQPTGWEAGVGPTLTGAGVQLAFAAGITHQLGNLNVPVNLAIAPGRRGASISITTGFNRRDR